MFEVRSNCYSSYYTSFVFEETLYISQYKVLLKI
jgi:hypothetical protein